MSRAARRASGTAPAAAPSFSLSGLGKRFPFLFQLGICTAQAAAGDLLIQTYVEKKKKIDWQRTSVFVRSVRWWRAACMGRVCSRVHWCRVLLRSCGRVGAHTLPCPLRPRPRVLSCRWPSVSCTWVDSRFVRVLGGVPPRARAPKLPLTVACVFCATVPRVQHLDAPHLPVRQGVGGHGLEA